MEVSKCAQCGGPADLDSTQCKYCGFPFKQVETPPSRKEAFIEPYIEAEKIGKLYADWGKPALGLGWLIEYGLGLVFIGIFAIMMLAVLGNPDPKVADASFQQTRTVFFEVLGGVSGCGGILLSAGVIKAKFSRRVSG